MTESDEIRFQASCLCQALVRNINQNFVSVSFEVLYDGTILVRFGLSSRSQIEEELIEDAIAEFSSMQEVDCIRAPEIRLWPFNDCLTNIVYR